MRLSANTKILELIMNISKTKLLLIAVILTSANIAAAGTNKAYVAQNDSIETKICVAAATGSKMQMNRVVNQLSSSKLINTKYELVANELSCNGVNVAEFAAQAGNYDVSKKLMSYRTKNVKVRDIASTSSSNGSVSGE